MVRGGLRLRAMPVAATLDDSRTEEKYLVKIVGACIIRDESVLMVERRQRSRGYWEFPGEHMLG